MASLSLLLSACERDVSAFRAGDVQKDFCGTHINFEYCQCAFEGTFCGEIAMDKGQAKDHVKSEYEKWLSKERVVFAEKCHQENGVWNEKKERCAYCGEGQVVKEGKCRRGEIETPTIPAASAAFCVSDSDCQSSCQGNILFESKCDSNTNYCHRVSEKDCALDMENFGEFSFPMICAANVCQSDVAAIENKRTEYKAKLQEKSALLGSRELSYTSFSTLAEDMAAVCQGASASADLAKASAWPAILTDALAQGLISDQGAPEALSALLENAADASPEDIQDYVNLCCNEAKLINAGLEAYLSGTEALKVEIKGIEESLALLPS